MKLRLRGATRDVSLQRATVGAAPCAVLGFSVGGVSAAAPQLPTIPNPGVNPRLLGSGSVYRAHLFPLPIHVKIPAGVWVGAQWTSQKAKEPPAFVGLSSASRGPRV